MLSGGDAAAPVARLPRGLQWVGGSAIGMMLLLSGGVNVQLAKLAADIADVQQVQASAADHRERIDAALAANSTRFGVLEATVAGLVKARAQNQVRFDQGAKVAEELQKSEASALKRFNQMMDQFELVPRRPR